MHAVPLSPAVRIFRAAGAVLVAVLVALIPARPAFAHNQLRAANPERDATLTAPPTQVMLDFVEPLNPTYTKIVITDAARQPVPTGEPVVSGTRGTVTFTQPLANGTYTVAYRVVSADGHPVQGSYPFTVSAATAAGTPSAPATPSADATPPGASNAPSGAAPSVNAAVDADSATADPDSGAAGWVIATVTLSLIVLAGAGYLVWRRRAVRR
ncbi:copper resistance protein CopC [Micromonospora sonneratiae]|uniref:Copper resistance protein CopC n=1 Tax=Micromonospora sonneratiae TaxID=1184706 RepID=A0ABW3YE33_9ACTN